MKEKILRQSELLHPFSDAENVFWTDAQLDASEMNVADRQVIAEQLGRPLEDIVSFTPFSHTNEVVVVDSREGLQRMDEFDRELKGSMKRFMAGWSEPITAVHAEEPSKGADRRTYDGVILVGDEFANKVIMVTGADCTPIGVRGRLKSGEPFVAGLHCGRKGTMTGIVDNFGARLGFLGAEIDTLEVFVGPSARSIEVPLELLLREATDTNPRPDHSWRVNSVSEDYEVDGESKVRYNNQEDAARRIQERLGLDASQIHMVPVDTVSSPSMHSFRRDRTEGRNALLIGMTHV